MATKAQIIEAIKVLQEAMKDLRETELIISNEMLRLLPNDDEYDLANPTEVIKGIEALLFLQSVKDRD